MIEERNRNHEMRLQDVKRAEVCVHLWMLLTLTDLAYEYLMTNFCKLLPEDRNIFGKEDGLEKIIQEEARKRTYTVATTGAKLTYPHARDVLDRFASSLVRERHTYNNTGLRGKTNSMPISAT
jgi:endoribonuclease Dicer